MKVRDAAGKPLDAEFEVESSDDGFDVILHARYGGRASERRSNVDYFPALELLLARLASLRAVIDAVTVDSKVARRLAWADRLLDFTYPVQLSTATDVAELRRAITGAQRTVARAVDAQPTGGNNHKRIRIAVHLRRSMDRTALIEALAQGDGRGSEVVVGTEYRLAEPNPSVTPAEVFTFDPSIRERALAAHANTQNSLADFLRFKGIVPRSPRADEPDFDLAWTDSGVTVAEVKSLSGTNEDRQLRLALGQVLHYRYLLGEMYGAVRAVLAVEREPNEVWKLICGEYGVVLAWPPTWDGIIRAMGDRLGGGSGG